ncbi:MAG: hypothetical protein K0U93_11565 [Gammaproteobacteria bacterium]|nr:hypothetical protein [Gammaproteobacteria bacterium]
MPIQNIPAQLKEGITLGPSRQLATGVFGLSALAVAALYATGLGPMFMVGGVLLVAYWVLDAGAKHVTRTAPQAIMALGWYEDGGVWCLDGAGEHQRCKLISAFPTEWLTFLLLADERNAKRAVMLTDDNVGAKKLRVVRTYLRNTRLS